MTGNQRKRSKPVRARAKPSLTAAERAVEEIRAIRTQLWKEGGGTARGVLAAAARRTAKRRRKVA